jgi:hypothetical protein
MGAPLEWQETSMKLFRRKPTPVVQYIAGQIDRFTLIDVGCSGGLDAAWRDVGPRLQAFGFDPMAEEIERLYPGLYLESQINAKANPHDSKQS